MPCRLHRFWFSLLSLSTCSATKTFWLPLKSLWLQHAFPKGNVSNRFLLCSVGTIIRSSLKGNPHLFENFSSVGLKVSGAIFFLSRLIKSLARFNSLSVADLSISVFMSIINLNSAFLIASSVVFFFHNFLDDLISLDKLGVFSIGVEGFQIDNREAVAQNYFGCFLRSWR